MRALSAAATTLCLTAALLSVAGASAPAYAGSQPDPDELETYLVTLPDPPLATYAGGIADLAPTAPHATGADRLDPDSRASRAYLDYLEARQDAVISAIPLALGRDVDAGLRYDTAYNGFSAELTATEASTVAGLPEVARVEPDQLLELHTDAGPAWIGAPAVWNGDGGIAANQGEGVVVGVIDTGVNFRHPAFAEVGPVDGHVHENPRGTFGGLCDPVTGAPFCNDKLIGMWDFTTVGQPTDDNGHGSHTASTAVGNRLEMSLEAPTTSVDRTISGVAPHANLISYKACLPIGSCPLTGTLGSIDQATRDQVDVINFSIGGGPANPWTSALALAFAGAHSAGVFVATSAGNSGPGAGTVGNPANAPWVFSIGASTHDRDFPNQLTDLVRDGEPGPADTSGKGLTAGFGPARVVYAGDFGNALCGEGTAEAPLNPFPPGTFDGEIVVCDRGTFARVDKARHVHEAGAGGFVLANDEPSGDSLVADPYDLPGVHIGFQDGIVLKDWIAEGGGPDNPGTAVITGVEADLSPENGDVMAGFSSRGPNAPAPGVIKPDITAPGVDILAAWEGTTSPTDPETYNVISGTSMSSPHAAGSAALVRATQPGWTPDEVRSAMMTTAFTEPPGRGDEVEPVRNEDGTPADPFDRGAGRIDLRGAPLAGLVLDETPDRYAAADPAAGGDPRTLNLPSLADPACAQTCSWTRELRSAADATVSWTASTQAPDGVTLTVEPETFTLTAGQTATVTVTADVSGLTEPGWRFGEVQLASDAGPAVPAAHLPVAVQPAELDDPGVELRTLQFRGNLDDEFGCTGDGRTDVAACGGPFLVPDGELSEESAARWGPVVVGVDGTAAQNIHDPNWTWALDEPVTVGGPMTVEWWAGCGLCGALSEDWTIRLWADGTLAFEERVTATGTLAEVTRLATTVTIPEVSAAETLTVHVDPVFVDSQQGTFVFYDSTAPCPATAGEGPCDSVVHMPLPSEAVDLAVTGVVPEEIPGLERRGGPRYRLTATIENLGGTDAGASHTEFWLRGDDRDDLLGLVPTPAVGAGEAVTVEVGLDTRGLNGDYTVRVTADAAQALADRDRANNVGRLLTAVLGNQLRDAQFE
ncbi:MAG: S8 family serine peptidase [Micromonosporaceae bacterium]|nr:S8 family serine peptidase [Micromonosporaceae bacterium]